MRRPAPRPTLPALVLLLLALGGRVVPASASPGAPTADEAATGLLRLVPPDAGVTLALVDLRGHVRAVAGSSLARSFGDLPAVKAWPDSPGGRQWDLARSQIERSLGAPLATIRDDLLGDAVVLALHVAPGAPPESARGLMLARVRDRALLARLIDVGNRAQVSAGSLKEVADLGSGDRSYRVRRFKPGGGAEDEYYRLFDDGTFAWSNSEALIRGVLGRKAGEGRGLADEPAFRKVRAGLPARPMAFVHVDPGFAGRILAAAPRSGDPRDDRAAELLARQLRAVEGIGLALEWRDGLVLHAHAVLDPEGLDARLARWSRSKDGPDALARRIPGSALAAAAVPIDFVAAFDALVEIAPGDDGSRLEATLVVLRGILLGHDVRKEVLPRLGPALIAYVDPPAAGSPQFALVGVLQLRDDDGAPVIAAALDSGLRTLLCLSALDPKRQATTPRLESRQAGPIRVTSLGGPAVPFAYGLGPDCLVVGTSADAVARFGTAAPDTRLAPFRARHFPDARAYAAVDVVRLAQAARAHREALAARSAASRGITPEAAGREIDKAVALLDLFDGAFFALSIDPDAAAIHQAIGLIAR